MFPTLLKKEIQDYLISIRFVVLLALCVLLIPLSLYVNFETYRRWSADYNEQVRTQTEKSSRGSPEYSGLRPPSALSVFAIADTGEHVKVKFLDAVRVHYADLDRLIFSKSYSDLISDGDRGWGFGGNLPGQESPKDPPRFLFLFPKTAESLAQSVVDIGLLLGSTIALFSAASVAFIKYDVR